MLNYHFDTKLTTTEKLLKELALPVSTLNFWKTELRAREYKKSGKIGSKTTIPAGEWV